MAEPPVSSTPADPPPARPAPDVPPPASPPDFPPPVVKRRPRLRLSIVWLVPIVALVIGAVLAVRAVRQRGPEITIAFRSAEGLEAGRTEVRYKEVVVGRVGRVQLSEDREQVLVSVNLDKSAESLAVADTRFWVVRPRIGTAGVSGLGTLFSGAYIGVDAGSSAEAKRAFVGLEAPPFVLRGEPGRSFVLTADDLGALDVGSPVYYRRTRVGRVVGYALDTVNDTLAVQVFIEGDNQHLVTTQSRFWNASGVDLSLNASGLTLNTQSLASVLVGGVAFANPEGARPPQAPEGRTFRLFATQKAALARPDGPPLRVRMVFAQSLRGLAVGAPVDLLGVEIGTVRGIAVQYDPQAGAGDENTARRFPVEVLADLYLARLGRVREQFAAAQGAAGAPDGLLLKHLVEGGVRAQARTGNLLTGQLYVALDIVPRQPRASLDLAAAVPTVPTAPGSLSEVQAQLADIVTRIGKVPFERIGSDLQAALRSAGGAATAAQRTLASANVALVELSPQAQRTLADLQRTLVAAQGTLGALQGAAEGLDRNVVRPEAPLQRDAVRTLLELQRAAQALRGLGEYLQQHPESLLRGKPADPDLPGAGAADRLPATDTAR